MVALLNQLNDHRRIAETAGYHDFGVQIREILEMFERDDKAAQLQRGIVKKVKFDEYGRSYTLGKRKTSSARVWMISSEHATKVQRLSGNPSTLPITQILVNNLPLNRYFVTPVDREKILRPFRLTGLIGAFNVFAIVRGGGTTGQSGAVAHGIAKALAAHIPDVEQILRKGIHIFSFSCDFFDVSTTLLAKLLRRDPRMVERKKTGLAKARKRVCATALISAVMSSFIFSV